MPPSDVEFRLLGPTDVAVMHQLLSVFGRAFDDPAHYDAARPTDAYLADLLANPGFVAVAATHGDAVVGGLAGYVLPKFEQDRRELYIYDLAVDEPFRRQGVASGLLNAVRRVAADRGTWVVYVQADRDDAPAVALYAKFGPAEDVLHFDFPPLPGG
jgi:aminoglycoside 3-N-acetyltransferase I